MSEFRFLVKLPMPNIWPNSLFARRRQNISWYSFAQKAIRAKLEGGRGGRKHFHACLPSAIVTVSISFFPPTNSFRLRSNESPRQPKQHRTGRRRRRLSGGGRAGGRLLYIPLPPPLHILLLLLLLLQPQLSLSPSAMVEGGRLCCWLRRAAAFLPSSL